MHILYTYACLRRKEGRKKEASKVKQTTRQSNTSHPRQSLVEMRRKKRRNKQGQTNNKAKQHITPKAVTCIYIQNRILEARVRIPSEAAQCLFLVSIIHCSALDVCIWFVLFLSLMNIHEPTSQLDEIALASVPRNLCVLAHGRVDTCSRV